MFWKARLELKDAKYYLQQVEDASNSIQTLFNNSGFKEGKDLTPEQFDSLFSDMRQIAGNRALTSNLYVKNGISELNKKLRELLFGTEPLKNRVDGFAGLKGVQFATLSHFLCAFDYRRFPVMNRQTYGVLKFEPEQTKAIQNQCESEFGITYNENYWDVTYDFFERFVAYKEIKNTLGLDNFAQVNSLLFMQSITDGDEDDSIESPFTSVSLEADLRDYLEKHLFVLEKGLKFKEKEMPLDIGRPDLVCEDAAGNLVVIETKKGGSSDKVVGQILRYIGALSKNGKKVRGIIIVNEPDERLNSALIPVKDFIKLKYYKAEFKLSDYYEKGKG